MSGVNEKVIENRIKDYLDTIPGCWYFKVHGGPYQTAGIPDILGCVHGRLFAIEVKKPGEKATMRQQIVIDMILRAGGKAGVAHSVSEADDILNS